jgi:hypothetical protein
MEDEIWPQADEEGAIEGLKSKTCTEKQRLAPATANSGTSSCAPLLRKGVARWSIHRTPSMPATAR